jgi:ribose/xylose/arabinose/galactoside ABC-type transport system permease subunit
MIPLWKVSVATAAGVATTCAVTLVCCLFVARKNPHPLVVALGFFAPVRFLSGLPTIRLWLAGKPVRAGTDEAHLAALTVIPLPLLIFGGLLFLVLVWIWMVRHIPQDHRWVYLGSLFSGLTLGSYLYFWMIGPSLLP